jgi:hypothetical protein
MKAKVNNNKKYILIGILSVIGVLILSIGLTYAFMQPILQENSVTDVTLQSCARLSLTNQTSSIALSGTNGGYPMSKNRAFQNTPYSFKVTNSCADQTSYGIYIGTLSTNTLSIENNIHYIITTKGTKTIISEGIVTSSLNQYTAFTEQELSQYNSGIGGTVNAIYQLYSGTLASGVSAEYDLYLYVDSDVTGTDTMGKTFTAGLAVKAS